MNKRQFIQAVLKLENVAKCEEGGGMIHTTLDDDRVYSNYIVACYANSFDNLKLTLEYA